MSSHVVVVEIMGEPDRVVGPFRTEEKADQVLDRLRTEAGDGGMGGFALYTAPCETVHDVLDDPPWWAG